jgi:O-antigen/teichoic acid export membrane protein
MTILLIDTALNVLLILVNYILVKRWLEVKIVLNVSDKTLYKKIFTFSGYTIFFIVAKEVQWQTDKTIIGLRLNTAMVTIYAAGAKVSSMFNQLGYTLSGMFLPRAIRIKEESNKEEDYRNYMVSMGRMILPPVLGVMIAYAFMGKSFMRLWMGEGFDLAFYSSIIMMGAVFIPMLEDTGLAILKARDKQAGVALTWLFSSIANIVLTWVTVPRFGIVAASVMTFVTSYLGNVLVMNFILKKEIGLHIFKLFRGIFRESWKLIFVSCLYFVIIYCMGITINSWLTFVIVGALFVVLYGITYIYSFLNKEQRYHLTNQIKKRKERKNGRNYNCN